jgi:hypothetical protein
MLAIEGGQLDVILAALRSKAGINYQNKVGTAAFYQVLCKPMMNQFEVMVNAMLMFYIAPEIERRDGADGGGALQPRQSGASAREAQSRCESSEQGSSTFLALFYCAFFDLRIDGVRTEKLL